MASAATASKASAPSAAAVATKAAWGNRCPACMRKVGLTAYVCRGGSTFCGSHRYAEEHACSFDFKGVSRAAIARNNPLDKGEKLPHKI